MEIGAYVPNKDDLTQWLAFLKEHIFNFHIHDNDGTRDMHLQPPYGSIDWEEFIH